MTFEASRRKQVLVLQPRGKALYEDDSSFASKMMAKMGWNKGNGLGKSQHGSTDFIQIRYKNNANGLGFDQLKDNQWTENESTFDSLLKSLNNNSNSNSADEDVAESQKNRWSLEETSKNSRARVHYKKFTRGKDVTKYSEKDLANIFGKKTLVESQAVPSVEVTLDPKDDKPESYGSDLIVNTGISVTDYFKQKMKSKLNSIVDEISVEQLDGGSGSPKKKNKKRKKEALEASEEVIFEEVETKKIKKKRKLQDAEPVTSEIVHDIEESQPSKKKKKSKTDIEEADVSSFPEIAEEVSSKKKKKKSKRVEEILEAPEEIAENDEAPKKKKKSKKTRSDPEPIEAEQSTSAKPGEPERPTGANAVYNSNVIQIPSYVAQKMASMSVEQFKDANIANVVGYGLTEDIEIRILQTKVGENSTNTDKYSLYNTDRLTTKRINPRKILSKLKRTKKSIQVI